MKKPAFKNVLEEALFVRWLLNYKNRPATKNMALTKEQVEHRGYMLNVVVSFKDMQADCPLIVEN